MLRRRSTPSESALWSALRGKTLGVRFKRQQPIYGYTVDFWCASRSLVIEVDGPYHRRQKAYDEQREIELLQWGVTILRFTNARVRDDLAGVLREIEETVSRLPERPSALVREPGLWTKR